MKLVVGLGNPGTQYERTRHNAGYITVDLFAQKHGATNFRVAHDGFMADVLLDGEKILLLKPTTYMNLSGRSVASAMSYYKVGITDLLVIVDDIALPCGAIRLRPGGSAGGHNGLRDIERAMNSFAQNDGKKSSDYARLRIGVDAPGRVPQATYVLESFTSGQKPLMEESFKKAVEAIGVWTTDGLSAAMNKFNAGNENKS